MLLILVLKKLTELTKGFGAGKTTIRQVGNALMGIVAVCEHGGFVEVRTHCRLLLGILIYLSACIICPTTAFAVSALDMLNCVRSRLEASITTHRTGKLTRTMDLHVHIEFILIRKLPVAFVALVNRSRILVPICHAVFATRVSVAFEPLVATIATI